MPDDIRISGVLYALGHLDTVRHQVGLDLRGGHKKEVTVEVSFSNHCYSRRPKQNEPIPNGFLIEDGPRAAPRDRIFCTDRHPLSLALPGVIERLFSGAEDAVFESNHHNVIRVEQLEAALAGPPVKVTYYVFFSMRKIKPSEGARYIKLFVESAYPEDILTYDKPKLGKPWSFLKKLAQCWEDHPGGNTGKSKKKRQKKTP